MSAGRRGNKHRQPTCRADSYNENELPRALTSQFTKRRLKELKNTFRLFDKDGNGYISTKEVTTVLVSLGKEFSTSDIQELIEPFDTDGDGTIDFREFLRVMAPLLKEADTEADTIAIFRVIDQDGDGYISKADLREVVLRLDIDLTDQDMDEMVSEADNDGDGQIGYEEFLRITMMQ